MNECRNTGNGFPSLTTWSGTVHSLSSAEFATCVYQADWPRSQINSSHIHPGIKSTRSNLSTHLYLAIGLILAEVVMPESGPHYFKLQFGLLWWNLWVFLLVNV